jgi:LmbE family N-acetylglucosaminyl deacetylase
VTFLHRPDGALANDLALREQLVRLIRSFRPDAVVAMDPTVLIHADGFIQHIDHREAGTAAVDAVYPAARNAMAFPNLMVDEGLEPHTVKWLYLFFTDQPNTWVDVSDTLELKFAALHEHVSQIREPETLDQRIHEWATVDAGRFGVTAVEAFRVIDVG